VIGDVPSSVGSDKLRPHRLGRNQDVLRTGPHAERVDVGVLEEKQIVVGGPGEQSPLQRVCIAVADSSEPARP
jgi:hypothetical protein